MLSCTNSAGLCGIEGFMVTVECSTKDGIPEFELIGLPDTSVKESKERIKAALGNNGFQFPEAVVTVNLAPADRKKSGSSMELAIMMVIMRAGGLLSSQIELINSCFIGELSLSGKIKPVKGVLCMCLAAKRAGLKEIYVPEENAAEAAVVEGVNVYPVCSVADLYSHLIGQRRIAPVQYDRNRFIDDTGKYTVDMEEVKGQHFIKRALEVAAAGGHNILLIGPPGTGKSMLAKRLPTILPDFSFDEAVMTTMIHSIAGNLPENESLITCRPFRSPHHTISAPGMVGGGSNPAPGEISLAHNGVLFMDELPEFSKSVTESLRQPLEDGQVTITRASGKVTYPSSFMLIAAMNPCKCGYYGHPTRKCTCKSIEIHKYLSKISGPLLDRFDIQVEVPSIPYETLNQKVDGEPSAVIRTRVNKARQFARDRYAKATESNPKIPLITKNADMSTYHLNEFATMTAEAASILEKAYTVLGLSARGYDRLKRVARTIADLDSSHDIEARHIAEAIQLRSLDRKYW